MIDISFIISFLVFKSLYFINVIVLNHQWCLYSIIDDIWT